MKFITGLPESVTYESKYDAILVVVDKLSKTYHYILFRADMTVGELAEVITQEVICVHRVPSEVISDCGSLFISRFLTNFRYSFCIE